MKYYLILTLLCLPVIFMSPYMDKRAVGENEDVEESTDNEEENGSGSGMEKPKLADEDNDKEDPETDLFDVNKKLREKLGGTITDPKHPDWKVIGDIMYRGCEELGELGGAACKKKKSKSSKKDATTRANSKWPLPVPYNIDGLGQSAKNVIQEAFDEFSLKTCITFRQKTSTDPNYMRFYKGNGCNSAVGRYTGYSKHDISLDDGCHTKNTAIHEIMHALGFYHEQSRTDRDQYVTINWENIDLPQHKKEINFGRETVDVTTYGFDYDYRSTMHYSKKAFGKKNWWGVKKETITPTISTDLGQCSSCGFSRIDALQLNARYCNEPKDTIVKATLTKEVKRWMAIYNGDSNDDFRTTLLDHLEEIYSDYYFTVSAYDAVGGFDKHTIISNRCLWVWRYYGRNLVVCYTRKDWPRYPSQVKINEIMREVVNQVKERGCHARTIAEAANPLVNAYGYSRAGLHVVIHGNGLRTIRYSHIAGFENFKCSSSNQASLVVHFGST